MLSRRRKHQNPTAYASWEFIKENKKTITRPRKRSRKQENRNKVRKQELDQERDHQSH